MVHDTVSSDAVTSRRMALCCFVPGVAAPIMPIPCNVPAPSSVLNAHPMECSSTIQCSECPSHGMFQPHLVFSPGDPCCCRWTESSCLDGCRPALFLDRVQQIVKERFDLNVRWRKLRSMQVFNAVPGTSQAVQCNTKSGLKGWDEDLWPCCLQQSLKLSREAILTSSSFFPCNSNNNNNNNKTKTTKREGGM